MKLRIWCAAAGRASLAVPATSSQDSRPVTLVVPYPAGGGLDVLARLLGQKLSDRLGKPVVIENRTGAGTVIGAASVAKAAPDGYTIMLGTSTPFAITVTLNKSLPYDPAKDFVPIALTSNAPFMLLVHPSQPVIPSPIWSSEGARPISYGSPARLAIPPQHGPFKTMTGINVVHVLSGRRRRSCGRRPHPMFRRADPDPAPWRRQGARARGVVVHASRATPDIPTVAEQGVAGSHMVSWQMTPRLPARQESSAGCAEIKRILTLPEIKREFADTGRIGVDSPPVDELAAFMRAEIVRLGQVVEAAGIAKSQ